MNNPVEIRDILLPEGVSIFPLAYGWWILLLGIVFMFLLIRIGLWVLNTSKKHYALKELKNIDTTLGIEAVVKMSLLLRRICNIKYKNASVLYGKEWVDFLKNKTQTPISEKSAELLIYAPFMNKNEKKYSDNEVLELKNFCKNWIGDNL